MAITFTPAWGEEVRVGLTFVAQDVELGGDDERRRQPDQFLARASQR